VLRLVPGPTGRGGAGSRRARSLAGAAGGLAAVGPPEIPVTSGPLEVIVLP
jgi:hypothetical protein